MTDLQPWPAPPPPVALRGATSPTCVHPATVSSSAPRVPSAGRYHLYLDFKHDDVVHTAQFVMVAP